MLSKLIKASVALILAMLANTAAQAQTADYFLLAASWEPGFCATNSGKSECQNIRGTYAGSHLSTHGLWASSFDGNNPQYCNVPQQEIDLDSGSTWCSMDPYGASASTLSNLATYMPGIQSCLDDHEWYKHGSCSGQTPDDFWATTINLIKSLGQTQLNTFIASNAGRNVTRAQLMQAATNTFGSSASSAIAFKCVKKNRVSYLTEVWTNLDPSSLNQFPNANALVTNANIAGTCPATGIYIARP
ncbi:ribonuclease [Undibacterium jejuense]|uniref:Ribonuclease n=1 Tax=Undibacterium jejuense TaxID=1344949 RepID=A0A923HK43_9BURK|nr:ribonuclease [Undibacterium jejuense]MBC3861141.1 ribonuclease [Undibacterium jejuense]